LLLNPDGEDFYSNDYLGLAASPTLHQRVLEAMDGRSAYSGSNINGSTGSRLLAGDSLLAHELEEMAAEFFQSPSALLFNSGYAANTGLLSALPGRHDVVLLDECAHASLKEGVRLSLAKKVMFRHNDLEHLSDLLDQLPAENQFVVTESLFSMDGDSAPLPELVELCEAKGAYLILDEAHSTGTMGYDGSGASVQAGLQDRIPIRIHTFGKALGVHGAVVCGSAAVTSYLVNFAHSFIYTTAMSPYAIIAIRESLHLLRAADAERQKLNHIIRCFSERAARIENQKSAITASQNDSPIQYLIAGENPRARALAEALISKGIIVKAIVPPTVPVGTARIRICLHSFNTEASIDVLFDTVRDFAEA
jgi:8-amino-7-oxononanoate synthase